MITWRRPAHSVSNTKRNGIHPSISLSVPPIGRSLATKKASPSDTSRSGSIEALARRAPSIGTVPMPDANSSPSPRNVSARATTQTSARVGSGIAHRPLIVVFVAAEVAVDEGRPRLGVGRRCRVRPLEGFVAPVVGLAAREVGTVGRLDDAVDQRAVDPQRVEAALVQQIVGGHDLLDRYEAPAGGGRPGGPGGGQHDKRTAND